MYTVIVALANTVFCWRWWTPSCWTYWTVYFVELNMVSRLKILKICLHNIWMVPKKTSKETDAILIDNVGQKLIDKCVLFFFSYYWVEKAFVPGQWVERQFFCRCYRLLEFHQVWINCYNAYFYQQINILNFDSSPK